MACHTWPRYRQSRDESKVLYAYLMEASHFVARDANWHDGGRVTAVWGIAAERFDDFPSIERIVIGKNCLNVVEGLSDNVASEFTAGKKSRERTKAQLRPSISCASSRADCSAWPQMSFSLRMAAAETFAETTYNCWYVSRHSIVADS